MSTQTNDAMVAEALAQAVRRLGRGIASEPRRVQASLNDELAAEARPRRAEVDAVVVAAEEEIPAQLDSPTFDRPAAMQRLRERGLADEVATFSIDAWQYGLGLDEPGGPAPTLTASAPVIDASAPPAAAPQTAAPVPAPPAPPPPNASDPPTGGLVVDLTGPPQPAVPAAAAVGTAGSAAERTAASPRKRARYGIAAGAFVAIVAVIALIAVVVSNGDPQVAAPAPESPSTLTFPMEKEAWGGEVTRTWTETDGGLHGDLAIANPTATAISGAHVEAFPKSLAATADMIKAEQVPKVLKADPILQFDVTVAPSSTTTISYDITGVSDITDDQLQTWKAEQAQALADYVKALDTTPPPLVVTAPLSGTALTYASVDVTGTTEPGAAVNFEGTLAPVDAAGNWTYHVDLVAGSNSYTLTAADAAGNTTAPQVLTLVYNPPAPPAKAAPVAKDPSTKPTGGGNTIVDPGPSVVDPVVTCADGSRAPDLASCPTPTPPVANDDSWNWTPNACDGVWCWAWLPILNNDSWDNVSDIIWVDQPTHGSLEWDSGNHQVKYTPHHNGDFTDSFSYYLRDQTTGLTSSIATVYVTVDCNTDYVCY